MLKYPTTNPVEEFDRSLDLSQFAAINHQVYKTATGKNLFDRAATLYNGIMPLRKQKLLLYDRRNLTPPAQECYGMDEYGDIFYGINFASADYLGLCTSSVSKEAAMAAAQEYSVNSCGSPLAFGASKYYMQLKEELKDFWQMKDVLLFSAGWLAGYGVIKGFIRPYDYVIMDELSHNCLQEGAFSATKNVIRVPHLDSVAMETKVKQVREANPDACILVITEGLFSMDSDYADLIGLQAMTKKYEAFLMIDCAHDFGCMGENGRGVFEIQGLKDFSNVILMSGGSKCLSTNVGWVAIDRLDVIDYLKFCSSAYMFTNAVNPVQCATALAQLRLLRTEPGKRLRKQVIQNYVYMKKELNDRGHTIIGHPSPIMPLLIGNEVVCRIVTRLLLDEGIHVNGIEYPVVKIGQARLRVNLQPQHTKEHLDIFIATFEYCLGKSNKIFETSMEKLAIQAEQREIEKEIEDKQKNLQVGAAQLGFDIKKPNL